METLQNSLNGYCYSIENFFPDCGSAGLANSTRRYLGERLHLLTPEQLNRLFRADKQVGIAAQRAIDQNSWEQDFMVDLLQYLEQEQQLEHREAA